MDDQTREKYLKIALVVFGVVFLLVYPLSVIWPSGWIWHGGQGTYYLQMICGIYAVLGIFLIASARNPAANRSLISFTIWSSVRGDSVITSRSAEYADAPRRNGRSPAGRDLDGGKHEGGDLKTVLGLIADDVPARSRIQRQLVCAVDASADVFRDTEWPHLLIHEVANLSPPLRSPVCFFHLVRRGGASRGVVEAGRIEAVALS